MTSAGPSTIKGVAFVNPDAVQARSRRRTKLAAARARISAIPSNAGYISIAGAGSDGGGGTTGGEKEVRKQQRMLRNRESAALSRKRKSDRIGELEVQVHSLEDENRRLRQRIDMFEFGAGGGGIQQAADCSSADDLPPAAGNTLRFPLHDSAVGVAGSTAASTCSTAAFFSSTTIPPPTMVGNFVVPSPATAGTSCFATAAAAAASYNNILSRPAVFA